MTDIRSVLFAISLPVALAGCKHAEDPNALPPAQGPNAPAVPSAPKIDSTSAESAVGDRVLRATGTTQALKQAELGPKASGVLSAVLVEEGQPVKKGQPLFRLDATNPVLQVKQAEASLAMARVQLTRAELDYNRMKPLVEQGAISQANWDAVRIAYDQAKVGVLQAQAAVASARAYAADTTVVAPFSGVVSSKKKQSGETVTMMPPTTVIVLQDTSKIEVRVRLAETALTRIKASDPMQVRFTSLNLDKSVPIDRINPSVDPMSRTVEVIGLLPNEDGALKAGMLVEVAFPTTDAGAAAPSVPAPASSLAANTEPAAADRSKQLNSNEASRKP